MTWPVLECGAADAPTVVLLHGFLGRGEDWRPLAEALAADHRVLCPDLPGHGAHAFPGGAGFSEVLDALAAWLDGVCATPFSLVGYSLGGRLALAYALGHPDRVNRLVLESVSPGIAGAHARAARAGHDDTLAAGLETLEPDSPKFRGWLEDWYAAPLWESLAARPELLRGVVASRLGSDPRGLAAALRALSAGNQPDYRPALPALMPPALFITGELDRKYGALAEEMAAACPHAARHVMAGCGHNVHLENPGGYTTLLRGFHRP